MLQSYDIGLYYMEGGGTISTLSDNDNLWPVRAHYYPAKHWDFQQENAPICADRSTDEYLIRINDSTMTSTSSIIYGYV